MKSNEAARPHTTASAPEKTDVLTLSDHEATVNEITSLHAENASAGHL